MEHGSKLVDDDQQTLVLISPSGRKSVLSSVCPVSPLRLSRRSTPASTSSSSAPASGWQIWAEYSVTPTFTSFLGNFSVPQAPAAFARGAVLFAFTGLENSGSTEIIQPVLQYGHSADGGAQYWGVASWYVTSGGVALHSPLMNVTTGDTILGNMTKIGASTWFINGVVNGHNTSLTVTRPTLSSQPTAYTTLELYSLTSCAQEPPAASPIKFEGLHLTDAQGPVTPKWTVKSNGAGNHCSATMTVVNAGEVVLTF